jgi:putative hydrolase of the HAD superfamily
VSGQGERDFSRISEIIFVKPYNECVKQCNCKADEMVYVGNEEKDVIGSKRMGMISCLVTRGGKVNNWGQDFTIDSLVEIMEFLK